MVNVLPIDITTNIQASIKSGIFINVVIFGCDQNITKFGRKGVDVPPCRGTYL